ncbi:MAG: hypothetical protein K6E98_01655 [Lachnospiraceae bacterium]|nr:hypothetical protein [Lachnospiraceae bacterium]
MPKPRKIRKKKSFMFTSRHYSLQSILALTMGICSVAGMMGAVAVSFKDKGEPPAHLGGVGLFGMLGNIVGTIAGMTSLNESDIYKWVSYFAMVLNMIGMLLWTLILFWGI